MKEKENLIPYNRWFLRFWTIKKTFNFCGFVFCGLKIRNKNCMWWPCLLTDRDEMSNLHRGHFMDASYQVSVVAMIVNQSGRNEQYSQRTFHRCSLPSFGSFGQAVSEEKIFKKSANQKQQLPVVAMLGNGS